MYADVDNGENTLNKKIRNGEVAQYNFILGTLYLLITQPDELDTCDYFLVVGQEELDSLSVNVRNRDDVGTKARSEIIKLDTVCEQLVFLKKSRSLQNKLV